MTEQEEGAAGAGWLPGPAEDVFGPGAAASEAYDVLTVDVPAAAWTAALRTARDELGCTFFDWLSAVDEPEQGFRVAAHVVAVGTPPRRLLLRTTVPHGAPALDTATEVYAGAAWHERETHEMFGVDFAGHPHLARLLLPEEFEGHPLRKDFVLAARVAKAWPGAKEPGEPHDGGPKRRQMQPPGVPDPNDWGPQKGQLPPAPTRTPRRAGARGDAPPRRARSANAGSASQRPTDGEPGPGSPAGSTRRARSAGEGSASQRPAGGGPEGVDEAAAPGAEGAAGGTRSAAEGSAAGEAAKPPPAGDGAEGAAPGGAGTGPGPARPARGARRVRSASEGSASQRAAGGGAAEGDASAGETPRARTRTPDAPWQRPRPDDEPTPPGGPADGEGSPPAEPTAGAPGAAGGDQAPPEPRHGGTSPAEPAAGEPDPPAAGGPAPSEPPAEGTPGPAAGAPGAGGDPAPPEPRHGGTSPAEPAAGEPPDEGGES
ncbi:NADH-quinone oxidoreductase subunit C [Streptomyces sp. MAR4 CNX-425]|uniref:NADH-quinone oxidoreductase subunit C n=1 Tax=Streptomyces sp. MAR4 CNX-425 TaxID=3406343 RepID=UPI003B5000EC